MTRHRPHAHPFSQTVIVEVAGDEIECELSGTYQPGDAGSWDDPPEGAAIENASVVWASADGKQRLDFTPLLSSDAMQNIIERALASYEPDYGPDPDAERLSRMERGL